MKYRNVALTVAGSDSGAGAGIQADMKAMMALGVYGTTVITAVTAQNTMGVSQVEVLSSQIIEAQLEAVFTDFNVRAVKTGMVPTEEIVEVIYNALIKYKPPFFVLDPVMVATSGDALSDHKSIVACVKKLFPIANIITPNLYEASVLLGREVSTLEQMKQAAVDLLHTGVASVLVKGGHLSGGVMADVWVGRDHSAPIVVDAAMVETKNTHGTGCTLSSAIAAYLATGYSLEASVRAAKQYVTGAISSGKEQHLGSGHGPVNHFWNLCSPSAINSEEI